MRLLRVLVFFFVLFQLNPSKVSALSIVRGPYLTMATPTSVTICWRTDSLCDQAVRYGLSPANTNNTHVALTPATDHCITVQGLQPNTRYYYSVGTGAQVLRGDSLCTFQTQPFASPMYSQPLRFWAVGDVAKQTLQQAAVRDAYLQHKGNAPVHGWIMLGDNAYNNGLDQEYQLGFFNFYQQQVLPNTVLWPVVGNHDYANNYTLRTTYQIPYLDIFSLPKNGECGGLPSGNERYYSFNYGNVHFINLDSYGLEQVNGTWYGLADTAFSPQVNWLKADLLANTMPWVIVSFHHPPYCMGTHNSDIEGDLVALRTYLNPILERYNVDLVLNGHCHTYQRSRFLHGHYGLEPTFDSVQHVRQAGSGHYNGTPNSCAYRKLSTPQMPLPSDTGTLYLVIGSGGAIPQLPFGTWPHEAMVFSNYADNGSLLLTVEGNRLDAEWISTDTLQPVKDRFTLFKHVGRRHQVHTLFPGTVTLSAGWPAPDGSYRWSHGDSLRTVQVAVQGDTLFTVQDEHECFTDSFFVSDQPLGLSHAADPATFALYPNPASDLLYLEWGLQEQYNSYVLKDSEGRTLGNGAIAPGQQNLRLELPAGLASGLYSVALHGRNGVVWRQFLHNAR
jgi:hypothetical protein